MNEVLTIIIFTTFWCMGLVTVTGEGMALQSFKDYSENKKAKIWMAVILCHLCMPTIHSIFGYAFYFIYVHYAKGHEINWNLLYMYPIIICGSSLLNAFCYETVGVLSSLHQKLKSENDGSEI